jgi:hypothetical protein
MLDWEMTGVGSGPQELAQYLISHMAPSQRRRCERALVREYYDTLLVTPGSRVCGDAYAFDQCWREYVCGGSERWMWFVALLASMCPAAMTQRFVDQLWAFCVDHDVTPDNVGQPRA